MTHASDDRLAAHLWDPAAPPDDAVRLIEDRLAPLRFDPASAPLRTGIGGVRAARTARTPWMRRLAAAAAVLVVSGASLAAWRWSWPDGRAWPVSAAAAGVPDALAVGAPFVTAPSEAAVVQVARIGTMRVAGGTALTLRSTSSNRHRLVLEAGTVRVRVWAPPLSLAVHTPAGDVFDMGCEFDLTVSGGSSDVRVTSGWVQLENLSGESVVPAGASTVMREGQAPGVAVFDDASERFRTAVRRLEGAKEGAALNDVVGLARARDMLTLLQLVQRGVTGADRLVMRGFELAPPPDPADLPRVLDGDRAALDRWMHALPLPPLKSGWWRNWRDALPVTR